jgi:hypothetical protein
VQAIAPKHLALKYAYFLLITISIKIKTHQKEIILHMLTRIIIIVINIIVVAEWQVVLIQAMNAYRGSGGIAPLSINLSEFDVQVTVRRDKFL